MRTDRDQLGLCGPCAVGVDHGVPGWTPLHRPETTPSLGGFEVSETMEQDSSNSTRSWPGYPDHQVLVTVESLASQVEMPRVGGRLHQEPEHARAGVGERWEGEDLGRGPPGRWCVEVHLGEHGVDVAGPVPVPLDGLRAGRHRHRPAVLDQTDALLVATEDLGGAAPEDLVVVDEVVEQLGIDQPDGATGRVRSRSFSPSTMARTCARSACRCARSPSRSRVIRGP